MSGIKASGSEKNERGRNSPYGFADGVLTLKLRVQPGAGKTEMAGRYGEFALKLRLKEPPRDDRANKACLKFLAKALGVPIRAVSIIHGSASRDKIVRITSVSPESFQSLIERWIS